MNKQQKQAFDALRKKLDEAGVSASNFDGFIEGNNFGRIVMNEDFVPFKLAKKLKEKGFNKHVCGHYREHGILSVCNTPLNSNALPNNISAPTIPQVLKWLREEKKIHVEILIHQDLRWGYEAWDISEKLKPFGNIGYNSYAEYNSAVVAGVEYVLDNLI